LDQLDQEHLDFDIVFITAYPDVQVKALDYFFLQYLTKPYDIDKIEKVIQQHQKNQNQNNENYKSILKEILSQEAKLIPIPNATGIDFISSENIIRLVAQRNYTLIYCQEGKNTFLLKI